jgi:hypothetical protein
MNLINIIAAIISAGVLERYQHRLGESGIFPMRSTAWISSADLPRPEAEAERYWRRHAARPSSTDRRRCQDISVETLMWGSDYPHPDGVWPELKYIEEQFADLSPDVVHRITCENAAVLRSDQLRFHASGWHRGGGPASENERRCSVDAGLNGIATRTATNISDVYRSGREQAASS